MAKTVHMPQWGMTMTEGKIVEWLKKEGDSVEKGEILFEVETEKIVNEVEAMETGILSQITIPAGETAMVGDIIGLITEPGENATKIDKETSVITLSPKEDDFQLNNVNDEAISEKQFIKATPAARRLSREMAIDIATVTGTGPGGRVRETDILQVKEALPKSQTITPLANKIADKEGIDTSAIAGTGTRGKIVKADLERVLRTDQTVAEPVTGPTKTIPYTDMRKSIGDNMMASLQNSAQLTGFSEVDVTEMVLFREMMQAEYLRDESVKISFNDIIILAVSRALKQHPIMNSTHETNDIILHNSVNMGIAVALPDGLIVPVLKNADRKGLLQISREAKELASTARSGSLNPEDVSQGTFTVSNTGMVEVDGFTPILRAPETGILGVGRIKRKPAEFNGEIVLRSMMWLSLTYNHCVVDGLAAHKFLETVGRYLQNPYLIMS